MADIITQRNIGALLGIVTSVLPESSTGGTINGTSFDRQLHGMSGSCVMHQVAGADTGSPTGVSIVSTLQHAPDNSTWTAYKPDGVNNAAAAALTAPSTENSLNVDLTLAYRYIRVSTVVTLTGGSSPAVLVAADLVLGGERVLAAV